jgi:cell division protein FtsL
MKRVLLIFLVLTIPAMLCLRVWQVYRYQSLLSRLEELDREQRDWLERNKKLLAAISVLRSPSRIEQLANGRLGLTDEEKTPEIRLEFGSSGE